MVINLPVKGYEKRACNTKGCLAVYNIIFEGQTADSKEPSLRGVRLFESDRSENKKYIRMPQSRLANGRYFNILTLPELLFRQLETDIINHYEANFRDDLAGSKEENVDIENIGY